MYRLKRLRRMVYSVWALLLASVLLLLQSSPTLADPTGCPTPFTVYDVPTQDSNPFAITAGSDGALWFSELGGPSGLKLARVTTEGAFTEYPLFNQSQITHMTSGPDGATWYTRAGSDGAFVGRITTAGSMTEFPLSGSVHPGDIVSGPDNALWVALTGDQAGPALGRITTTGVLAATFTVPTSAEEASAGPRVESITVGPDGALWFLYVGSIESNGIPIVEKVGRMTLNGDFSFHSLSDERRGLQDITAGPDGALWFIQYKADDNNQSKLFRLTTSGDLAEYQIGANPFAITAGPDNTIWFTNEAVNRVSLNPFEITTFYTPNINAALRQITAGPDGAMWFTDQQSSLAGGNTVSKIPVTTDSPMPMPQGLTAAEDPTNQSPSLSWSSVSGADHYTVCRDGFVVGSTNQPSYTDNDTFSDGPHTYSVIAVNALGQKSFQSRAIQLLVDKTAPVISGVNWTINPLSQGESTTLSAIVVDTSIGLQKVEYNLNGGTFKPMTLSRGKWQVKFSHQQNPSTDLPSGIYDIVIRASDHLGNIQTAPTQLIVGVPAPTQLTANTPTRQPTLTWNGVGMADHYDVYRDGVLVDSTTATTYTDTGATDGSHEYFVVAVGVGGNSSSPSNTVMVMVDTTAPTTGIVTISPRIAFFNQPIAVSATAFDALSGVAGGEYYIDTDPGQGSGQPMNFASGRINASVPSSGLSNGLHTIYIRSVDEAGNWSTAQSTWFIRVGP